MHTLSDRLLQGGWCFKKLSDNLWRLRSPLGFQYDWCPELNHDEELPEPLHNEILSVENAISQNRISKFFGTAHLVQPPLPHTGSPLACHIAHEHIAKGHAVLRFRTAPDEAGDTCLLHHGAWRVETLLPPWNPPASSTTAGFSIVLCEHLLDTLPNRDRKTLTQSIQHLTPGHGAVYFSVFQMTGIPREWLKCPYEDGYEVPYGRHKCFIKPYNESMLRRELTQSMHGTLERAWIHYHELVYTWRPHV